MHELALAQAVIDTAAQAARDARICRITRITVRVGELQGIDPESFEAPRPVCPPVRGCAQEGVPAPARAPGHRGPTG